MAHASVSVLPKRWIGISTKMYFTPQQTLSYASSLISHYFSLAPYTLFLIPDFLSLWHVSELLRSKPSIPILLGAQDSHWEDRGAYTGEVSPLDLKGLGCSIVELGHAERRRAPLSEDAATITKKAQAAIRNGLIPLVCIGEQGRSSVMSEGVGIGIRECGPQVRSILQSVPEDAGIIFAYEPIWAIGAQEPASGDHVLAVVGELRKMVPSRRGDVRFLYGGSAGPGTWNALKDGVDGLFLGRFAHDLESLGKVLKEVEGS